MPQKDAMHILQTLQTNLIEGYQSGSQAMLAWGANTFKASEASDRHGISWLLFKCDGSKFSGWVRVALRGIDVANDTGVYSISLEKFNNTSAEYGVVESVHSIKECDLGTAIDRLIESKSA